MTIGVEELRFSSAYVELYGRLRSVSHDAVTRVLLPGLGFHSFEYEPLATWLAEHEFNCFSFDYRGHGRSGVRLPICTSRFYLFRGATIGCNRHGKASIY